jgi:hypothetical protein
MRKILLLTAAVMLFGSLPLSLSLQSSSPSSPLRSAVTITKANAQVFRGHYRRVARRVHRRSYRRAVRYGAYVAGSTAGYYGYPYGYGYGGYGPHFVFARLGAGVCNGLICSGAFFATLSDACGAVVVPVTTRFVVPVRQGVCPSGLGVTMYRMVR